LGIDQKIFIFVGVGPLRSARAAEYICTNVPGVIIPDSIVEHLRKAPKSKQREEGKRICGEIIERVREIEGVAGMHIMAYRKEYFRNYTRLVYLAQHGTLADREKAKEIDDFLEFPP
jgi:methylenetetrahydrofolate reductase (NADPH)